MNNSGSELDLDPTELANELLSSLPEKKQRVGRAEPPKETRSRIIAPLNSFTRLPLK